MSEPTSELCREVLEHLSEVLDGSAEERLLDHVADCDHCRDLRHEAARAERLVKSAGADFAPSADFEQKLTTALVAALKSPAPEAVDENAKPAPTPQEEPGKKTNTLGWLRESPRRTMAALAIAAAVAGGAGLLLSRDKDERAVEQGPRATAAWSGSVAELLRSASGGQGLRLCTGAGSDCRALSQGDPFGAGSLETDATTRASLRLEDGSLLTLDRSSVLVIDAKAPRRARLVRGALVADIARMMPRARFDVPPGHVEVLGTKFSLRAEESSASVEVSRGAVRLVADSGREVEVHAGQAGWLERGRTPEVSAATSLWQALAWSETERDEEDRHHALRGLGQLKAKKPGADRELDDAVRLTAHRVSVRIAGAMARTEVDEVFTNETDDVLEGIYRFPIPADAQIERLALEVDGKLEEGAFVDRERAAKIWRGAITNAIPKQKRPVEEIIWVPGPWKDPALLEWQRGGQFELRIYPIPKRGSRRVVLTYTQVIKPTGGVRRYVYPLPHDPSGSTRVGSFSTEVQVRGHDSEFGVRASGYDVERSGDGSVSTLRMARSDFAPTGDLLVEYALRDRDGQLTAWAFRDDGAAKATADTRTYVALALRPRLPLGVEHERRDFAFVVDASRSMYGERYRRAIAVATRTIRELDAEDRVNAFACDVTCRALPGGPLPAGNEAAAEVERFLGSIAPEGASDVTAALTHAASASSSGDRALRLVYIGDGTPTVGAVRPALVEREAERAVSSARATITAVAVGSDADTQTLAALARGGGGVLLPYVPGQSSAELAYTIVGATYGTQLRNVRVELPQGLYEVAPRRPSTLIAGDEAIFVARSERAELSGDVVLKGTLAGKSFEQRYPLKLAASSAQGNAFVPRLFAALRIADLEQENSAEARKSAVELSSAFNVASRHTSLLVLESAAMFRAFGLDNTRRAPEWTGELEAESEEAEAVALDEGSGAKGKSGVSYAQSDLGFGSGGGVPSAEAKKAERPMGAPVPAAPAEIAASQPRRSAPARDLPMDDRVWELPPPPRQRMVPMRRIWERVGQIRPETTVPKLASPSAIAEAESALERAPNNRTRLTKLYTLYALSGSLDRAHELAERWSEKEPLDPQALTARADVAARRGDRELAIRILGSVIDVRPDDVKSQLRLARLHRWSGEATLGCRYSIAVAQMLPGDAQRLSEALRCAQATGLSYLGDALREAADEAVRTRAHKLLEQLAPDDVISGDFRVELSWTSGDHDLDAAILDAEGNRVSFLGAPTRAVISARNATSRSNETLGLRGAKPGEYVVEVVRSRGEGFVRGRATITVAGTTRAIDFELDGPRRTLATVTVNSVPRLVPATTW
jgi:tetratricopeptide (TPR) repeat protein